MLKATFFPDACALFSKPSARFKSVTMRGVLQIVGAGLAGSEAAFAAAELGVDVILHEMRPKVRTFAHKTGDFAEMVCSNSFRSDDHGYNAVGLLHWELRQAGSLIMQAADANALPAGAALAVDREGFARFVTERLRAHPRITVQIDEVTELPTEGHWIIATGPLTSERLARAIQEVTGTEQLAFYDAIAPIVHFDSIDLSKTWFQSRYDKGDTDEQRAAYLNCPMTRAEYEAFVDALLAAPQAVAHEGDPTPYFDGCLPIEEMAARGRDALRHGPMKPVGLSNPHNPHEKPYAVVQLRRDNALGTLWNMVGFQTRMKHSAQVQVFRMIPGLEHAVFARLGGIHRNTFINSPRLLDREMRLKMRPNIRFAGQITGVEGYVESAAMGFLAGRLAAAEILGLPKRLPPRETAIGALLAHITGDAEAETFQPMNVNFGLFPPLPAGQGARLSRRERSKAYTDRAKAAFANWLR